MEYTLVHIQMLQRELRSKMSLTFDIIQTLYTQSLRCTKHNF